MPAPRDLAKVLDYLEEYVNNHSGWRSSTCAASP